jgi:hypothetical protein
LLSLIALHVSAALFHHFWRRDDTLTAMLPAAAAWRTLKPRTESKAGVVNFTGRLPMK